VNKLFISGLVASYKFSCFTQHGYQDVCSFCYPYNLTSPFNNGGALFCFYEIVTRKLIRGPLRCNDCLPGHCLFLLRVCKTPHARLPVTLNYYTATPVSFYCLCKSASTSCVVSYLAFSIFVLPHYLALLTKITETSVLRYK
jgi:hypothetical protein